MSSMPEPLIIRGKWTIEMLAENLGQQEQLGGTPSIWPMQRLPRVSILVLVLLFILIVAIVTAHALQEFGHSQTGAIAVLVFGAVLISLFACALGIHRHIQRLFFRKSFHRWQACHHFSTDQDGHLSTDLLIILGDDDISFSYLFPSSEDIYHLSWQEAKVEKNASFITFITVRGIGELVIPRAWVTDEATWSAIHVFLDKKLMDSSRLSSSSPLTSPCRGGES